MKISLLHLLFVQFAFISLAADGQNHIDDSPINKNDSNLYAIVISKNNSLVYERYFNNKSEEDLFNDQSLTKTVISILIGIAIDKGFISSLDEKLEGFFPELKQDTDKRKQTITIRQVMNQASGLYHEDLTRLGDRLGLSRLYLCPVLVLQKL